MALSALLVVALAAAGQPGAQAVAAVTLVKAARLLDPRSGAVLAPGVVPVEGDKITQVGPPADLGVPGDAKVVDLGAATLLPGLIDGHTHPVHGCRGTRGSGAGAPLQRAVRPGAAAGHRRIIH